MRRSVRLLFSLALASGASACTVDNPAFEEPQLGSTCQTGESELRQTLRLASPRLLDVLMLVDAGPGSEAFRERLGEAMPAVVAHLNSIPGLDWQAGVVSMDIFDPQQQGRLQRGKTTAECRSSADRPYILRGNSASAANELACMVQLPTTGPSRQPVYAAQFALVRSLSPPPDDTEQRNRGLIRPDSQLLVLFLTTRDDCSGSDQLAPTCALDPSAADLAEQKELLATTIPRFRRMDRSAQAYAALLGPRQGDAPDEVACETGYGVYPATRLHNFLRGLTEPGHLRSSCSPDLADELIALMEASALRDNDSICPAESMPRGPLDVVALTDDNVATRIAPEAGYLFLGPTAQCPTGELALSRQVLAEAGGRNVQVTFCSPR